MVISASAMSAAMRMPDRGIGMRRVRSISPFTSPYCISRRPPTTARSLTALSSSQGHHYSCEVPRETLLTALQYEGRWMLAALRRRAVLKQRARGRSWSRPRVDLSEASTTDSDIFEHDRGALDQNSPEEVVHCRVSNDARPD
jgi:hypothetical protein